MINGTGNPVKHLILSDAFFSGFKISKILVCRQYLVFVSNSFAIGRLSLCKKYYYSLDQKNMAFQREIVRHTRRTKNCPLNWKCIAKKKMKISENMIPASFRNLPEYQTFQRYPCTEGYSLSVQGIRQQETLEIIQILRGRMVIDLGMKGPAEQACSRAAASA